MLRKLDAQVVIPTAITVGLLAGVVYATQFYAQPHQLADYIHKFGPMGIVAYVLVVVLANVVAIISATPLLVLGHSIYGQHAVWLFALGNILAMAINFYLARRFGYAIIVRLVGESGMSKIESLAQDYGLVALFLVRVFLSGISDLASYAFGLSPIKFRPYMIVSIIGALPPYLLLYFFSGHEQSALHFLLLQLAIAGLLAATYLASRAIKNRFLLLLLKGR